MDAALFHEPRRRMIRLPDGEMAALDFGDAARPVDVLFVHANGFNAATYRSILGPLSLSLRIMAVDLRGHGASRLPADPVGRRSWNDFRDDLVGVLDALGGPPLVLSGHSMGGTSALLAAAERPDRVKSLVLFDPVILKRLRSLYARAPWTSGRAWRNTPMAQGAARRRAVFDSHADAFKAYRGRGAFKTWPETMLADYVSAGFRERPDGAVELTCAPAWESSNFASQAHDPWRALRRVRAPLTIYRAGTGSTCGIRDEAVLTRRNPGARLFTVEGASHFLPMERPDIVRDALLDATD